MNAKPDIYVYKRVLNAKLFIDEHYETRIDLNNIAGEACFSKFHFIRLFARMYGITPHQYLTRVRIEKAKLLLQQQVSVNTACYTVGFDSISTFTSLFKRRVKQTPALYQQLQFIRQQDLKARPLHYIPNCFAVKIAG